MFRNFRSPKNVAGFQNFEAIAFSTCFSVDLGNMLQIMANQGMLAHIVSGEIDSANGKLVVWVLLVRISGWFLLKGIGI